MVDGRVEWEDPRANQQEIPMYKTASSLIVSLALAAASCSVNAAKPGATAKTTVGVVERAEPVTLDSNAGKGAVVGGTLGLLGSKGESSTRQARNAIIGAGAGAAIANASQGSRSGWRYTVRTNAGSTIAIVSDQSEIRTGDCVVVEESGSTANIRRASSTMCQRESAQAVAQVSPQLQTHAAECVTAKQQVVDAQTADQVDLAMRKVKILCDE
jgi:hypothetical protein